MSDWIKIGYLNILIDEDSLVIKSLKDNSLLKFSDIKREDVIAMPKKDVDALRELIKPVRKRVYNVQGMVDAWDDHKAQDLTKFSMSKVPTKSRKKKGSITTDDAKEFAEFVKHQIKLGAKDISFKGTKMSIDKAKLILQHFNNKGVL